MQIFKAVAGYVIGSTVGHLHDAEEELVGKLLSIPKNYVSILLNLDDQIRLLRRILPRLNERILNAEVKRDTKELYGAFRRFYEDAMDILDEYDTEIARRRQRAVADPQPNRFRTLLNLVCSCLPCSACFDFFDYESVPIHFYEEIAKRILDLYDVWEEVRIVVDRLHIVKDVLRGMCDRTTRMQFEREIIGGVLRTDMCEAGSEGVAKKVIHDEITFLNKSLPELYMVKSFTEAEFEQMREFDARMTWLKSKEIYGEANDIKNKYYSSEYEQAPLTFYVEIANRIKGFYDSLEELRSLADKQDLALVRTEDVLRLMRDQSTEEQVDREITDWMLRRQFRLAVREGVNKKKVTYEEIKFQRKILPKLKLLVPNTYLVDRQVTRLFGLEEMDLKLLSGEAENLLEAFDRAANVGHGDHLPWPSIFSSLFLYLRTADQIKGLRDGLEIVKSDEDKARQFLASAAEAVPAVKEQSSEADGSHRRPVTEEVRRADLQLVGREQDMEEVTKLLLEPLSKPSVVLVKGLGGVGKTTLVQGIFDARRICEHFEIKKWVCVGNGLHSKAVVKEIFDKEKGAEILPKLKGKRFLIVLDDCWIGKMEGWEELWKVLSHGGAGSKVLITSRQDVKREFQGVSVILYELRPLSKDDCLCIFESFAFPNGAPSSSSNTSKLQGIGKEIVEKIVCGLPLMARILGSSLSYRTQVEEWKNVLKGVANKHIMEALMWSYRNLPTDLKQCFSYLSAFPKDHRLEKEEVVWMWIAHGYIKKNGNENLTLESIGKRYFDDLVGYSLVQKIQGYYGYKMHDIVHNLAIIVSRGGYFIDNRDVYENYVPSSQLLIDGDSSIDNKKKLWTLLKPDRFVDISKFQMQYVRALSLSRYRDLSEINFSKMACLRYLDLTGATGGSLPESICSLYNLQTLQLNSGVSDFPLGRWKLPNLRHLKGGDDMGWMGIGSSTSLQTISNFNLSNGEEMEELGNLNELVGKIAINNLNLVKSWEYASKARLDQKEHIEELVLAWRYSTLETDEEQNAVLENLHPPMHGRLRILQINWYMGDQSPSWLRTECLSNLVKLTLDHLVHIKELPLLGQYLPMLEHLHIKDLRNVRNISNGFHGTEARKESWLPSLKRLVVQNCEKLTSMPRLPERLRSLVLHDTGLKAMPEIWTHSGNESDCYLENLSIVGCHSLHTDEWFQKHRMLSLTDLEIRLAHSSIDLVINYSRKCLRSVQMYGMHFLRSITLSNLDTQAEVRETDYQILSISLGRLDMLECISIMNSEDGKITAGPFSLTADSLSQQISKLEESISKFKRDEEYNIENEVDLHIRSDSINLKVKPRKLSRRFY